MSKPNTKRFKLSTLVAGIEENRPPIEIEGNDDVVFTIPPAELWPDDVTTLSSQGDTKGASKALLGDQYDDWIAQGGTFGILNEAIAQAAGLELGKSSASSN